MNDQAKRAVTDHINVIAATKLQIWMELMRQPSYSLDGKPPKPADPLILAQTAEDIFLKLCAGVHAVK